MFRKLSTKSIIRVYLQYSGTQLSTAYCFLYELYLKKRWIRVKYENECSKFRKIQAGESQGSTFAWAHICMFYILSAHKTDDTAILI